MIFFKILHTVTNPGSFFLLKGMHNNAALIIMKWKRLELEILKLLTKLSVKWLECIGLDGRELDTYMYFSTIS